MTRVSHFPLPTLKETPADAEIVSHRLMLRAGCVRRLSAGLYTWLPPGLRVLRKVAAVVREEMDAAGAIELLMPAVQPAELWQESGRWSEYGPELLRFKDRHDRDFVFGPTHEEVITDFARRELSSYRQLPVNYYQVQTKFRDEIRPRFGVMRAREFLMKDAYSFHLDDASLDETYQAMFNAYCRIFQRLQIDFRAVLADTGSIGGSESHEFHVLADSGEDSVAFCDESGYAANVELSPTAPGGACPAPREDLCTIDTPGVTTIQGLAESRKVSPRRCLKALFVNGADVGIVGIFLRGDHTLNVVKAARHSAVASPLEFSEREDIIAAIGCPPGSLGPVGLAVPVLADYAACEMSDFITGANQEGRHFTGVNWGRDLPQPEACDLRNIEEGDPAPGGGRITLKRSIEVGHIFKLGDKYSSSMGATVLDENGAAVTMKMGCYGIGVSRIVAAAVEQNHDAAGIIWSQAMAPFDLSLVPIRYHGNARVRAETDRLYEALRAAGVDPLLDDRDVRPGVAFADSDLLGLPWRLVVSEKGLQRGEVELKNRRREEPEMFPLGGIAAHIAAKISGV